MRQGEVAPQAGRRAELLEVEASLLSFQEVEAVGDLAREQRDRRVAADGDAPPARKRLPLVVDLHGFGASNRRQARCFHLCALVLTRPAAVPHHTRTEETEVRTLGARDPT